MSAIFPDFETFRSHHNDGKSQLIWTKYPGDLDTPVSACLKLWEEEKHTFLLESIEGGATLGRYSIIGFDPDLVLTDPSLDDIRDALKKSRIDVVPESLPPMAVSGLFGYLGYGMIKHAETIPDTNPDSLNIPDSVLIRPRVLVIFDNIFNEIFLVCPVYDTENHSEELYKST